VTGQTAEVSCWARASSAYRRPYAVRQRGLSVILIDRPAPGSETSYGNAVFSAGLDIALNNPSLWNALPQYLTNRHPALRWILPGRVRNVDGSPAPGQCDDGPVSKTEGGGAAGLIGASLKAAKGMDRESECGAAHPRDRLAESMAQRRGGPGKNGAGLAGRIRIGQRASRATGHFRVEPNILPAYKDRTLQHRERRRSIHRCGGQVLCALIAPFRSNHAQPSPVRPWI